MFRLRVVGKGGNIEVSVQNPLKPDDPNAADLVKSIEWINSFPKPEAAYRARMLQIAQDETPRRRRAGSASCASRSRATAGSRGDRQGHRHRDGDAEPRREVLAALREPDVVRRSALELRLERDEFGLEADVA